MSDVPSRSPGTVSRILWHFTGGPLWNAAKKRQNRRPKPAAAAYQNLVEILRTRELRLGEYAEVFRLTLPEWKEFDSARRRWVTHHNKVQEETSAPVCCLSDIPAMHLGYHAERYGKFAIGFHRHAAVAHGFNPVMYGLETSDVVNSIYSGLYDTGSTYDNRVHLLIDDVVSILRGIDEGAAEAWSDAGTEIESLLENIDYAVQELGGALNTSHAAIRRALAFVKTFSEEEFATVYCEREWRAVTAFDFAFEDVAMIVLPREVNRRGYHRQFADAALEELELPRTIPVVPWEDLVEH